MFVIGDGVGERGGGEPEKAKSRGKRVWGGGVVAPAAKKTDREWGKSLRVCHGTVP